jgi:hypothetical protein
MSLHLFNKTFSVAFLGISSAVPCHHKRSIIHALPPYIKEEMKFCENIKRIRNQVSNSRTNLISIFTGDNIAATERIFERSIKP